MDLIELFRRHSPPKPGGFMLIIPGTFFGSKEVDVGFQDGQWVLNYQDDGRMYEGRSQDLTGAYLVLIGNRLGVWDKEGRIE